MVDSKYTPLGSLPTADAERQRQLNKFQRAETLLPSAPLANVILGPAGAVADGTSVVFDGTSGLRVRASLSPFIPADEAIGELVIDPLAGTPLIFADIVQDPVTNDLVYA